MRVSVLIAVPLLLATACGGGGTTNPPASCGTGSGTQCPTSTTAKLTVQVNGASNSDFIATAVEFYDNQNVRHFCYDPATPVQGNCSATLVKGSQVRIQRLLGLIAEDEGKWRLAQWGGACLGIDPVTEPRGGWCNLTMDSDKNVVVGFERRAKLWVQQVLYDSPMSVRWQLAFSPQKAGGNPTTRAGEFDCNSPSGLPVCEINNAFYDVGTVITLTAGSSVTTGTPAFWKNWGIGCAHAGQGRVCTVTLTGDLLATGAWGFQ